MSNALPIPVIPECAPFSPTQRAWLNGFLAGFYGESEEPDIEEVRKQELLF
jgi:sulfite reductase (NADPH) flavoprotein alpha-component